MAGCWNGALSPFRPAEQPPSTPTIDTSAKISSAEKDGPKRPPKPETCVAFGRFQLEAVRDGNRTPEQCRELNDTARKYFQQAIKMDPNCVDAHHGLTQAYEGLGDHARTIEAYQKAQKAFPKDASFYFDMGMYQARRKEWNGALENLTRACDLAPEQRMYANMRGHCLARMGRYDEALTWFSKTIGEAEAHYNVARMLHHNKQGDACKQHLHRALELNPNLRTAQEFLAQLESPQSTIERAGHATAAPANGPPSAFASEK
jgi:tetratricopeptide (TPR) repeat protein